MRIIKQGRRTGGFVCRLLKSVSLWQATFQQVHLKRRYPLRATYSRHVTQQHSEHSMQASTHFLLSLKAFAGVILRLKTAKARSNGGQIKVHHSLCSWSAFAIWPLSRTYYMLSNAGHRPLHSWFNFWNPQTNLTYHILNRNRASLHLTNKEGEKGKWLLCNSQHTWTLQPQKIVIPPCRQKAHLFHILTRS